MNNKLVRVLLALTVSFALWLYVVTAVSTEQELTFSNISVSLQNETMLTEERNLMITSESIPTISLTLRGNRSEMNKLSNANITAVVDLSQVYEPGQQQLTYRIIYPEGVSQSSFEVIGQSPNQITLDVEKRVPKEVPVNVVYTGELPEEFTADTSNHELSSTVVNIIGPSSVVEEITQAQIEVDLSGREETIVESFAYTLCNEAGEAVDAKQVVTDVGEIELKLKIQKIKEVPLTVTVVDGGGATEKTSQIEIDPKTIKVSGSETVLDELESINIGTINLGELTEDTQLTFSIKIPENVTNLTGVTEAVVDVKFPELGMKTLTITNISALNVPEGMQAELDTKALSVTVRGPKAQIEAIKETDVSATVDFKDAKAGSSSFTAEITINSGFSGVGAVNTYSVTATLRAGTEGD